MYSLTPVGQIRSSIKSTQEAPRQGFEGAPDAWLDIDPAYTTGLKGISAGDELIIITWLHQANREVLEVHPRGEVNNPLTGVFATRSPARPNPLGLHRVSVREVSGTSLLIGPIEAIDGTPVLDIKHAFDDRGVA